MRIRRSLEKYLIHFVFSFRQKFKVFLLSFAVLVAATSAVTVCKCEDKKVMNKSNDLRGLRLSTPCNYSRSNFCSCVVYGL